MTKAIEQGWTYLRGDRMIWMVVIFLFIFSMLAVYSATGTLAYKMQVGSEKYLIKQILMAVFGLSLMYITHLIDYKYYSRIAQLLWFLSIPLLIYTMFFGVEINDANRWLMLPGIGLTFQTSDLAKLALIMFLARQLSLKQEQISDFKEAFIPVILPIVITCVLIAPDNLSTSVMLFFTSVFVMFIGRIALKHLAMVSGISLVVFALFFLLLFLLPDDLLKGRMLTWKHRIENYTQTMRGETELGDEDYQIQQAKIAIAKGGLFKINPGGSDQKNFLPHPYSDFIYAIIIEEYGLAGGAMMVLLYLFFLYRCIRIVIKAPKAFGALLAVGLGIALVTQAMINMAVTVNLVPVTGVTLPLVSMGGSSVIFTSLAFGIILSVSRNVEEEKSEEAHE
ncbi:MAG: FtsW/RodA/SpoVE family cell cycle protein [Chitinophagales bacterium]|nr:FtsW/RodA/SpoVE family cell cycle protein [Chitinophagales bacterium]